jgi:hypothetical protein
LGKVVKEKIEKIVYAVLCHSVSKRRKKIETAKNILQRKYHDWMSGLEKRTILDITGVNGWNIVIKIPSNNSR